MKKFIKIYDKLRYVPRSKLERYWVKRLKSDSIINLRTANDAINADIISNFDRYYDELKKYGISGLQFGNYVNQQLRYEYLIVGLAAMHDLTKILKFKTIGSNVLAIAIGARGVPKSAAHYEADLNVINLTKRNGWGTFAHEYGHFLDFFIGGYFKAEQDKRFFSLSGGASTAKIIDLQNLNKDTARYKLNLVLNKSIEILGPRLKRYGEYYNRRTEIWARVFERYVSYLLTKNKIENRFLSKLKYDLPVYLTDNELKLILPDIENLMNHIRFYMQKPIM